MASITALFGAASPAIFVEREAWEHGFAAIYDGKIAPRLARLEARRLLTITFVVALAAIAFGLILCPFLLIYSGDVPSRAVAKIFATLAVLCLTLAFWLSVRFSRRDEGILLPAICEQFAPLRVAIAPPSAALSLDAYWQLNVIPQHAADIGIVVRIGELFTGMRHGRPLSIAGIEVFERRLLQIGYGWVRGYDDYQAKRKGLFRGTVIAIALPDPGARNDYAASRFRLDDTARGFAPLPDPREELGIASAVLPGGIDVRGPTVERAVAALSRAYQAPVCGAVSGNTLYLGISRPYGVAQPFATTGLWISVYRCEPAIRRVLAEIAAIMQLADAVDAMAGEP